MSPTLVCEQVAQSGWVLGRRPRPLGVRIESDPMECENCGPLDHADVETVADVPRLDSETYAITGEPTDVYVCGGCHAIIGVA